jgi:hypothetical protein
MARGDGDAAEADGPSAVTGVAKTDDERAPARRPGTSDEGRITMGLRVIGAGFGRTGSSSLKAALERLGFGPCDHMGEVFFHPERALLWEEALDARDGGQAFDWERLYAGYAATTDWPRAFFWRELVAAYPEAKVILSVRDPKRWYDSMRRTVYAMSQDPTVAQRVGAMLGGAAGDAADDAAGDAPDLSWMPRLVDRVVWQGTFGGRFTDEAHALQVFADHRAAVEAAIPPERLLVHAAADGWEPLCRFLGVPLPAEPYPHLNEGANMAALLAGEIPDRETFLRRVRGESAPPAASVTVDAS